MLIVANHLLLHHHQRSCNLKRIMAQTAASQVSSQPFEYQKDIKSIAQSSQLKVVPSKFSFANDPTALTPDSLPVVDFSALVADELNPRSRAVRDLHQACCDWGFFILVNHGIPEELTQATFAAVKDFFALPENEKKKYEPKSASDPIKVGNLNLSNTSDQSFTLWRDYLKFYVHPEFHCPDKPQKLREVLQEYTGKSRKLARKLVEAILEAMELDQQYVDETLNLNSSFQMFAANLYPPCPQPDQAIGLPPHTDPGLLTLLIDNGVAGLQIEHDGLWFNAESPKNSILVHVADHLEIFSNGRCKSVKHRAVLNSEKERISMVVSNGPAAEAEVGPAAALVKKDRRAVYRAEKYMEYLDGLLTKCRVGGKSLLEQAIIHDV